MSLPQFNTYQNQVLLYGGATGGGSIIGPQGTQGVQGVQGFIGNLGNQGVQGNIGPLGNQGWQGYQGNQGEFGIQGNQGWQGYQGDNGLQGSGVQGDQGDRGFQGFQGLTNGITITSFNPSVSAGTNLQVVGFNGGSLGQYMTIGSTKYAWASANFRWSNSSNTGGSIGNVSYIAFPSGFFTTVNQFLVSVSEVGGDGVQLANGDLSGSNQFGYFWVYRPVASGGGATYTFTISYYAIGV